MIESISKTPTLTIEQAKYLNYIVEYENGSSINGKQLVKENNLVRLKVIVEFRKDITASDLPSTTQTLNLSFVVNCVQSSGEEVSEIPIYYMRDNQAGVRPVISVPIDSF